MKSNMGNLDKGVRILLAVAIAVLYYLDIIQGILAYVLMAISIIFLLTSLLNFCPLYKVFGIKTNK